MLQKMWNRLFVKKQINKKLELPKPKQVPDHDKLLEAISKSKAGLEDPHVKAVIKKNLRRKNERSAITSDDQKADSGGIRVRS